MDFSIYHLRLRDLLTLIVLALLAFGCIMVQSASMAVTGDSAWHLNSLGTKHAEFAVVAFLTYLVVGHLDYRKLNRPLSILHPVVAIVLVALFTCAAVLVPHVGITVNGARRWLPLGVAQLQPSELGKWAVVIFLAWFLTRRPVNLDKFTGLLLSLVPIILICLLIVIQDFGTAALIGVCTLCMLIAGRAKLWHLAVIIPPGLAVAFWFVRHKEYRWKRMTAFLNPWASPQGEGYHMIQSLLSFSTGGLTGRGLGNGIQKLGYLPEDTTDFIFAVICEELGLFGAILTAGLYLALIYVVWQVIRSHKDPFAKLLAFGIGAMVGLQAMINLAVATVSVPTKGLSLPLISAGGSGLVITCAALGLLLSITRHTQEDELPLASSSPLMPQLAS
ncbi:MAG TPA: putative peptidoglycan glycosyltransferase FtsW [Tepidisphaeraceae bacterium]|nr:putative peptidoglycan glycosyltransferase FtsW [Tepidisphaeraceae bacterium]